MTRLPRPSGSWARSGWTVESAHVPGSYRLVASLAGAVASPLVTVPVLVGPLTVQQAAPLALLLSAAQAGAGFWVYARASTSTPTGDSRWAEDAAPPEWPSVDRPARETVGSVR